MSATLDRLASVIGELRAMQTYLENELEALKARPAGGHESLLAEVETSLRVGASMIAAGEALLQRRGYDGRGRLS